MLRALAIVMVSMVSAVIAYDKTDCNKVIDIGFILDSSGSLKKEYPKEKRFVTDIASTLRISASGSRAGVITFSHKAKLSIQLNDYMNTDTFNEAVRAIPFMGFTTRIDRALKLAQSDLFIQENGGRDGVTKILVMLTDGTQTKSRNSVDPAIVAEQIRESGVLVIVIGVGRGVDREELDHIAGGAGKAYIADSFDELIGEDFVTIILGSICSPLLASAQMCPPGVPFVNCIEDPCSTSSCQANPAPICQAQYCGECKAKWFDVDGNEVECGNMVSSKSVKVAGPCAEKLLSTKQLPGAFIPSCNIDGTYEKKQCHASTGHCWCVTKDGKEIEDTRTGPGEEEPNCGGPCTEKLINTKQLPGAFIPSCNVDGTYKEKQCHASTGHCWCVTKDGKEIEGTRTGPGEEEPNCGECPPGVPIAACAADPCSVSSCQSNPQATCRANYCGGCNTEWFDEDGNLVDCDNRITNSTSSNIKHIPQASKDASKAALTEMKENKMNATEMTLKDNRVCWRHLSPGCVNGHNIIRYKGKTIDECKKLCANHPDCRAFEYGVPHGGSRRVYKTGDCQLNSGSNAKNCDGVKNNLDLYIQISCKYNVCWKRASPACARAHNIKRVKNLSLEQCKRLCAKTEGCVAFEYGVNHGGARKHYRPRDCQLNTWTNTKGCDGFYNNLDFYTMTNCDTTCYKHVSPGCVRGHNIRRIRNKTVDQCKSICGVTPNCVGFEYGVNHGGARKHYRVGDCQLNTGTDHENCDGHHNNLDFYLMYHCVKGHHDEHTYNVW